MKSLKAGFMEWNFTKSKNMPLGSFLGAILAGEKQAQKRDGDSLIRQDGFFHEIQQWINFFDNRPSTYCHVIPTAFIFDYARSNIIYVSPSIQYLLGYNDKFFLDENGIARFIDLINPNDLKVYNEQIFPKEMQYLTQVPQHETQDYVFSTTLRLQQASGGYRSLLMKKGFAMDAEAKAPVFEFGVLFDITPVKKELSIVHTIERFDRDTDCSTYSKVHTQDYYPDMDAIMLSAREKEILLNLSKGTKRKDVGAKLFISDNTVANHIKTILRKTNSKNIREAIAICKMNGII